MPANYNRSSYYTPSTYTQLMQSREAHAKTQDELREMKADRDRWSVMAERLYDIMLAHESISDDDWNKGIEDCHKLMVGSTLND